MALTVLRTLSVHPSQLLYIASNCNPKLLNDMLKSDFDTESIPYQKFGKIPGGGHIKYGMEIKGPFRSANYDMTYMAQVTPQSEVIMTHTSQLDISDYENVVAVWNDGNSALTDFDICRGVADDGEHIILQLRQNALTPDFIFYGKDEHGNFVRIGTPNFPATSTERQPVSVTGRTIHPMGPWDTPYTTDYVNTAKLVTRWTNDLYELNESMPYVSFRIAKDLYSARKYAIDEDEGGLIDEGTEPEEGGKDLYEMLYFKQEYWYGFVDDTTDPNSRPVEGYYDDNYTFHETDMNADFYAKYQFNLRDKPNLCMYIGTVSTPDATHADDFFHAKLELYLLEREGATYYEGESQPVFISNMGSWKRTSSIKNIADYYPIGIYSKHFTKLGQAHGSDDYILFGANMETNIPIFRTRSDAEKYLRGEIGKDQALNNLGASAGEGGNLTGHILNRHTYNEVNAEAVCSECLCCSASAFQEFFNKLFDVTNRDDILKGLELYGTDTASFIVDTFAIPFDYTVFQDTQAVNELTFGSYHQGFTSSFNKTTKLNPKIVHAFSCSIVGGFNDWRDWQSEYYLSLPYVGKNIHINKEVYLYKLLECDVSVDVRTGSIKYFIKCNGVVTDTYEGVCRISMPIQTTNNYSYSREKLGAAASVATGLVGTAGSIASGNVAGLVGNVTGVIEGTLDLEKAKPINTTGNCSPANAWNDPLEAYLIIQTPEYDYSQNIKNTYGIPANYVGTVGGQSGYVECQSVFLKTSATEDEQTEILNLLNNGVII